MLIHQLNHQQPAVAQQMHRILMLAYEQERAALNVAHGEGSRETVEDLRNSSHFHFGALMGEELLGWISLSADPERGHISIELLVVHPAHQRQGIGRSLVENFLQQGNGAVFSVVAAADNLPALSLYRSLGFTESRRGAMGPQEIEVIELQVRSVVGPPSGG